MVKNINLSFDNEEYEKLKEKKEELSLTWKEALEKGLND